jgi:hypothetical protein
MRSVGFCCAVGWKLGLRGSLGSLGSPSKRFSKSRSKGPRRRRQFIEPRASFWKGAAHRKRVGFPRRGLYPVDSNSAVYSALRLHQPSVSRTYLGNSNRSAWFIGEASVVLTKLGESVERDVATPAQTVIRHQIVVSTHQVSLPALHTDNKPSIFRHGVFQPQHSGVRVTVKRKLGYRRRSGDASLHKFIHHSGSKQGDRHCTH